MQIEVIISGDKFSPKNFKKLKSLSIENLVEYNKISKRGRYKGKLSPYGVSKFKLDELKDLDFFYSERKKLKKIKDLDISIYIDLDKNEEKIIFSKKILKKIFKLKANIEINYLVSELPKV